VIVNMERWRCCARIGAPSIGNAYVILNIPDIRSSLQHGEQVWTTKVVNRQRGYMRRRCDGDDEVHTPSSNLERAAGRSSTTNICRRYQQDPMVLERMGLKLDRQRRQHPYSQPPGERNALGRIRFNFPNKFLGLSARHAGQEPVRAGRTPVQPRLHAVQIRINMPRSCSTSPSERH